MVKIRHKNGPNSTEISTLCDHTLTLNREQLQIESSSLLYPLLILGRLKKVRNFGENFAFYLLVPSELYGPLMTCLTLVAVLQMNMKTSKTSIEEATLIETALTTCFGYWAFLSCFIYCAVYICSSYINTIQVNLAKVSISCTFGKHFNCTKITFRLSHLPAMVYAATFWSRSFPSFFTMEGGPSCSFGLLSAEHRPCESVQE